MTDSTDAEMEAKKETARAKAEARRQRILAKQGDRMGVVSGGTEGQTGGDGGSGDAADAGTAAEGMASPSSGMSKYAAARRRRYGNKKAAAAPAPADAASAEESSTPAETEAAAAEASESKTGNEEPAESTAPDTESAADKKKYMGVAKMRRKMIAEKKKKEETEASTSSASGRKLGVPRSMSNVAKASVKEHRAAVLMQLFTLVLLFLAGLGVGIQNHALNDGVVTVSDQLSHSENGIGALRILGLGKTTKTASEDARDRLLEQEEDAKVTVGANGADAEVEAEGDEFGEDTTAAATDGAGSKPKGVGGDDKVPNIDPLFRVDLDELTAGPGIVNVAARLAVKVHRSIMYLLVVMPLSIIKSIFALPSALMTNPPILFLLSVVIRYVGRDLLGARLPDLNAVQGDSAEEKGTDLIGSAKSMATNFLSSSFPAAAKLLEVFSDAKQDMFVILCGVFVGTILPFHLGKEAGKDEL
jgi:hypothetical protein